MADSHVTLVTIKATATKLLTKNIRRLDFTLKNDSVTAVYYGYTSSVATSGANKGWLVDTSGGFANEDKHVGELFAIAASEMVMTVGESTGDEIRDFVKKRVVTTEA